MIPPVEVVGHRPLLLQPSRSFSICLICTQCSSEVQFVTSFAFVFQEYSTDEDATTVVSLSESECGSMGSFEKFVHCSLPPPAVLDPIQRSRIPFKMQPKEEKTARKTSRIPISVEKHNKVVYCVLVNIARKMLLHLPSYSCDALVSIC